MDYDQVYSECEAQIEMFIALTGKLPDYIHGHAYGTEMTDRARRQLAEKYNRPYTVDVMKKTGRLEGTWYVFGGSESQLTEDPIGFITSGKARDLAEENRYIVTHCGYAGARLFPLSIFNLCRKNTGKIIISESDAVQPAASFLL